MSEQMIKVTAEDGYIFDAFRVVPDKTIKGGVVVLQEIFGMTEQLKNITRFWAGQGYDTILPALYDRIEPGTVLSFSNMDKAQAMAKKLEPNDVLKDIKATVGVVDGTYGVSLIGFCWGGGAAARMAGLINLKGSVAYYGTMLAENTASGANCATLFHFGKTDPHSSPEVIARVKKYIPDVESYVYEAGHAFANDARPDFYVEQAALDARSRTLEFLDRVHGAKL
jgi:carboxymethylenebutenolidase